MGPETKSAEVYYRWTDADGRLHVVSSLDSVPESARGRAERVELGARADVDSRVIRRSAGEESALSPELPPWASFAAGFGTALLLVLLFRALPQSVRWLGRLALVLAAAALVIGGYLALIRRTTGAGQDVLASPSALVQDARDAVEQVRLRREQQERELRAIQAEGK